MRRVCYIGSFGEPSQSAAGMRVFRIAKILRDLGTVVDFICLMSNDAKTSPYEEKMVEGFRYVKIPYTASKLKNGMEFYLGTVSYPIIRHQIADKGYDSIFLYNPQPLLTSQLLAARNQYGYRLYGDITEWYEIGTASGREDHRARMVDYRIRKIDHRLDGIIAISPYFHRYYQDRGHCNVIEIPPLCDQILSQVGTHFRYPGTLENCLNLVYSGSPAQKDLFLPFIQAVETANRQGTPVRLDIVGISPDQLKNAADAVYGPEQGIHAHGRLPHAEALQYVQHADFSFLIRNQQRYAKAGFSTKFAESLSLGVPVICNRVGGADVLLEQNLSDLLIDEPSSEAIAQLLCKLAALDACQIVEMKQRALEIAQRQFAAERYLDLLSDFLWRE